MAPDQPAPVGQIAIKTFQQMTKADDICCDLQFKGYSTCSKKIEH